MRGVKAGVNKILLLQVPIKSFQATFLVSNFYIARSEFSEFVPRTSYGEVLQHCTVNHNNLFCQE